MRSVLKFKRMLGIFYLYAARLLKPSSVKSLPPAQEYLKLETTEPRP